MRFSLCVLVALFAVGSGASAQPPEARVAAGLPDEVYLTDGSRLAGTIQKMGAGTMTLETRFAGLLKIDTGSVRGITSTRRFILELKDGSRASGVPSFDPATSAQRLAGSAFGDVPIAADRLAALWPEGAPEPPEAGLKPDQQKQVTQLKEKQEKEAAELQAKHLKQIEEVKNPPVKPPEKWTARIELGLNGKTGNTERTAFNGRAQAQREADRDRLLFYIEGHYAHENGRDTTNEVFGGAKWERDLSDRWFVFLKTEMERDEFEKLDLRATASGGLGYFFIREKDHELKARAGAGFQHESYQDGTNTNNVILEAGYDYRLDLFDWLRFTHSLTYYPVVDDPIHDYRLLVETAGEVPLGSDSIWKLRTGMRNEYDPEPRPGVERLDTTYFLNLVAEWK